MNPDDFTDAADVARRDQLEAQSERMREALKQWSAVIGDFSTYLRDAGIGEDLVGDLVCQWNYIMAERVIGD
jgi:hypothetical protein